MPEGEARNVLERFAKLGVSLNGLVIPGRSIESVLARHALTLVVVVAFLDSILPF